MNPNFPDGLSESSNDESDEGLGACSRFGCFTVAFWMRFIGYPSTLQ